MRFCEPKFLYKKTKNTVSWHFYPKAKTDTTPFFPLNTLLMIIHPTAHCTICSAQCLFLTKNIVSEDFFFLEKWISVVFPLHIGVIVIFFISISNVRHLKLAKMSDRQQLIKPKNFRQKFETIVTPVPKGINPHNAIFPGNKYFVSENPPCFWLPYKNQKW